MVCPWQLYFFLETSRVIFESLGVSTAIHEFSCSGVIDTQTWPFNFIPLYSMMDPSFAV